MNPAQKASTMEEITVIVRPNAGKDAFLGYDEQRRGYRVAIKASPERGKANQALLKFLSRHFKKRAELVSGAASRTKRIRLS